MSLAPRVEVGEVASLWVGEGPCSLLGEGRAEEAVASASTSSLVITKVNECIRYAAYKRDTRQHVKTEGNDILSITNDTGNQSVIQNNLLSVCQW